MDYDVYLKRSFVSMLFVDMKFSDYFTLKASTIRGHDYKLFQPYSRLNVRKHFFCERVVHCGTILSVAS